jgi:alpha-pyrone synthase
MNLGLTDFYCDLVPDSQAQMTWQVGDTGFEMALSAYVPKTLSSGISSFCHRLLAHNQYSLKNIDLFAIHPGGKKILHACEEALGITKEDNHYAYDILKNCGNMSSATILFILQAMLTSMQAADDGKNVMGLAFGPGLTLESMLLRVTAGV